MTQVDMILFLLSLGFIGYLILRFSGDLGKIILNKKGEGESGGAAGAAAGEGGAGSGAGVKFTTEQQKQVDHIVQERIARERQKYGDYEDLRKFKTEFEQSQDKQKQDELVKQRKYEEAEKGYQTKIGEIQNVVNSKDGEIKNLKISHVLTNEIIKLNGFVEESAALLFKDTNIDNNGNVIIKGKDSNGLDVTLPVAEGVKRFLETRPHLVKSNYQKGSGSGSGGTGSGAGGNGSGGGQGEDHNSLNAQLKDSIDRGDRKKAQEIKTKLNNLKVMIHR